MFPPAKTWQSLWPQPSGSISTSVQILTDTSASTAPAASWYWRRRRRACESRLCHADHQESALSACRLTVFHPARRCHPGFMGMRCEHADLLAVVATNHRQTVTTALVLCVIGCVLVMILCTLLQWVPPYPAPFLRSSARLERFPPATLVQLLVDAGVPKAETHASLLPTETRRILPPFWERYCLRRQVISHSRIVVFYCGVFVSPVQSSEGMYWRVFLVMSRLQTLGMVSKAAVACVLSGAGPSAQLGPVRLKNLKYSHPLSFFSRSGTVDLRQREAVWLFIPFLLNELLWGGIRLSMEDVEEARPWVTADVESYRIYSSQDIPIPIFVF